MQRSKLTEQREMNKQVNLAVTNNEEGDETEFLERVAGIDFSENVIASPSPQRGSIRPKSASSGHRKKASSSSTTPFLNRYDTAAGPTTPKSDKKKKKKKKGTYQSDLDFYDPPQLPAADGDNKGSHSPTLGQRQKPKPKGAFATFNPDDWWSEQQRLNPDAPYKMPIRRSQSDPVLKRPKSAGRLRSGGDNAMSTKDLKNYLTVSLSLGYRFLFIVLHSQLTNFTNLHSRNPEIRRRDHHPHACIWPSTKRHKSRKKKQFWLQFLKKLIIERRKCMFV